MSTTPHKKGGAMPGAGRPVSDRKRMLRELEIEGLNQTLSIIAQNIIEYKAPEKSKDELYQSINKFQPKFLGAVKSIIEK